MLTTDNFLSVKSVLSTLKHEAISCPKEELEIKTLMNKYDMLIIGEKFNTIYSDELSHSLKTKFNLDIDLEELNQIIPALCENLNMKCKPMKKIDDISNPLHYSYQITLFE